MMDVLDSMKPDTFSPTLSLAKHAAVYSTLPFDETRSDQDLPEPCYPHEDLFVDYDDFNDEALFNIDDMSRNRATDLHHHKVLHLPPMGESANFRIAGDIRDKSDVYSMDIDPMSVDCAAYGSLSDIEYGGILFPGFSPHGIAPSPMSYQSQQHNLQEGQSHDYYNLSSESEVNSDRTTSFSSEYDKLALLTSTDSEQYSEIYNTASASSNTQATSSTAATTSLFDLDPSFEYQNLPLPLSIQDHPPPPDTVETSSSNSSSSCSIATPPSPVTAATPTPVSGPAPAPAPRPRRGRPPKYSQSLDSKSSQDLAREQNRLAAQRFRGRREAYMNTVRVQAEDLEVINTDLKKQIEQLREEKLQLRGGMLHHAHCGCGLADKFLKTEMKTMQTESADGVDGNRCLSEKTKPRSKRP